MNELTTKLAEVVTQLQNVVKDNAADAVNLGLAAVRMKGVADVIEGFVCLALFFIGVFAIKKIGAFCKKRGSHLDLDDEPGFLTLVIIIGVICFVCFLIAICNIFSTWNYVAIFQPKLYLAHQVINSIGAK